MFYDSEWDMTESVVEIQQLAIKLAKEAIEEQKGKVLKAWKTVYFLEKEVEESGFLSLEEKLPELKRMKVPYYDYLERIILLILDGIRVNLILEIMTNDFYTREQDATTVFILYLYMLCIKEIANRPFERTVEEMMQEKLVLIPREYWEEFC